MDGSFSLPRMTGTQYRGGDDFLALPSYRG